MKDETGGVHLPLLFYRKRHTHTHNTIMQTENAMYTCQKCGSANVVLNGRNRDGEQQYYCKNCKTSRAVNLRDAKDSLPNAGSKPI
jgi:transposase-like protein